MEPIRCLIVDDEPLALDLLASYIDRTPFLQLVGRANSATQAMELLSDSQTELMFLDIQMPGLTGTDFARTLRNGPRILFSTAFPDFAVEGFRLDAIDYLVKPYDYAEFLRAAQKAQQVLRPPRTPTNSADVNQTYFFVKSEYRLVRVDIDRILYIESMKDYVKIFMQGETRPVITLMSLKSLTERLPQRAFQRMHRSYIAHLKHVSTVEKGFAVIGQARIPIADKYKATVDENMKS